jgi:hypothetical protein
VKIDQKFMAYACTISWKNEKQVNKSELKRGSGLVRLEKNNFLREEMLEEEMNQNLGDVTRSRLLSRSV